MGRCKIVEDFIRSFFKNPNAVLLIEGKPGSGKTILSLTIAKILKRKVIYISTQGSPYEVIEHIPIAKKILSKDDLIDARARYHINKEDVRVLRTPDGITLIEQLRSLRKQKPNAIIIIDSIQAFEKIMLKSNMNTSEIHQILKGNWIYISEKEDAIEIQRDVTGVIKLSFKLINQRRFRIYEIIKSRGVAIKEPFGIYTLIDGQFRSIKIPEPQDIRQVEVIKYSENMEKIPIGISKIDKILRGGLRLGKSLHVILPQNLQKEYISDLFGTLLLSWFDNDKKLVVMLPCDIRTDHINKIFLMKYTKEQVRKNLVLLNAQSFQIIESNQDFLLNIQKIYQQISQNNDALMMIFVDSFLTMFSPGKIINLINRILINSNVSLILLTFEGSQLNSHIMEISDLSMRLSVIFGSLIAYIEKPYHINPFFVSKIKRNKKTKYELIEIL